MKLLNEIRQKDFSQENIQTVTLEQKEIQIQYDPFYKSWTYICAEPDISGSYNGSLVDLKKEIKKSFLEKTGMTNFYKNNQTGRPKTTGTKRVSFIVSCQPDELIKIKELAAEEGMKISEFILYKVGIKNKANS